MVADEHAKSFEQSYSLSLIARTEAFGAYEFGADRWNHDVKASTNDGSESILIKAASLCGIGIESLDDAATSPNEGFFKPSFPHSCHLSEGFRSKSSQERLGGWSVGNNILEPT
jgi:hypothetical protein